MIKYDVVDRNIMQKFIYPFIVKILNNFQTDSLLVIIMEYCPGR